MQEQLFIFDVCGTLVSDDTTVGLLDWHFRRRNLRFRRYFVNALFAQGVPNFFVRAVEYATKIHFARKIAIFLLRGELPEEVSVSAQEYANFLLESRLEGEVFQLFQDFREQGLVVLVSASVNPVVEALGRALGVEVLSSELERGSSGYTGYLSVDLLGRKTNALFSKFGPDLFRSQVTVVSDNFSDADLLRRCQCPWIVLRKPSHRDRWSLKEANYLEVWHD